MKQFLLSIGLIVILVIGQSLTPIKIDTNSNRNLAEKARYDMVGQDKIKKDTPVRPNQFRLNMYDAPELTESTDWFSTHELMEDMRILCCPDWDHYKEWALQPGGGYNVICSGQCGPPPSQILEKSDFVPIDAVALVISQ